LRLPKAQKLNYQYIIISRIKTPDGSVSKLVEWEKEPLEKNTVTETKQGHQRESRSVPISGVKTSIDDGWFGKHETRQFCRVDNGWLGHDSEEVRIVVGSENEPPVKIGKLYQSKSKSGKLQEQQERGETPQYRLRLTMLPYSCGDHPHPHDGRGEIERRGHLMDLKVLQPMPLGCDWKQVAEEDVLFRLDDPDLNLLEHQELPYSSLLEPGEGAFSDFFWQPPARLDYYQLIQPRDGFACMKGHISIFSTRINQKDDGSFKDYSVLVEVLDAQSHEHIGRYVANAILC
jgi:hypothetical protein